MRRFNRMIFMGRGDAAVQCNELMARLKGGLITLEFSQQPAHSESEQEAIANAKADAEAAIDLEDVVRDIAAALLGRNIEITDKLPYP